MKHHSSSNSLALRGFSTYFLYLVAACLLLAGSGSAHADTIALSGTLAVPREEQCATLLTNGKILITGGQSGNLLSEAELFDPATGISTPTGSMTVARINHTATLLPNGRVLIAGGISDQGNPVSSAEIYDPRTATFTATGSMMFPRFYATATLLRNGKVLVVGGNFDSGGSGATSELFDPASGTWTLVANQLNTSHFAATATLLADGRVLVAGGQNTSANATTDAEIFDPGSSTWSPAGTLQTARFLHSATLLPSGQVLVAGGLATGSLSYTALSSAELYNPSTNMWSSAASMLSPRAEVCATLLPNGQVLMIGGGDSQLFPINGTETYNPGTNTWTAGPALPKPRTGHTTTLLPGGAVLILGGLSPQYEPSCCLYQYATGNWSATGSLNTGRVRPLTAMLPDGRVLAVGPNSPTAELYDPGTKTWTPTGSASTSRTTATLTTLANGKVLYAGGLSQETLSSAEIYDPAAGTWSPTGSMNIPRQEHTATLLANGQVLVAGGFSQIPGTPEVSSAELYDPDTATWSLTGSMKDARRDHAATLLVGGRVLVCGGNPGGNALGSAEIYDPVTALWSYTANTLSTARSNPAATLLPGGEVLVTGGNTSTGQSGASSTSHCELYNPATQLWSQTGSLNTPRTFHTATLLADGTVLVAGGVPDESSSPLSSTEIFNPATGLWMQSGNMAAARELASARLLRSGQVLMVSGLASATSVTPSCELFDPGLGFSTAAQPQLLSATSPLVSGSNLVLTGSNFLGISEASSGGGQNSSTDFPLIQVMSLANEQSVFAPVDPSTGFTATSDQSSAFTGLPGGLAMVRVFTNGIPSPATLINYIPPLLLSPVTLTSDDVPPLVFQESSFAPRAKAGSTITLTFGASEPIQLPTVTLAGETGGAVVIKHFSSQLYTASIVVPTNAPQGPVAFSINATNMDGTKTASAITTTDSSSVVIDTIAPTAQVNPALTAAVHYYANQSLPDLTPFVSGSDAGGGGTFVSQTPAPGTRLVSGTDAVTFTVYDVAGNTSQTTVDVVVLPFQTIALTGSAVPGTSGSGIYTSFAYPEAGAFVASVKQGKMKANVLVGPQGTALLSTGTTYTSFSPPNGDAVLASEKKGTVLLTGLSFAQNAGQLTQVSGTSGDLKKILAFDGTGTTFLLGLAQGKGITAANDLELDSVTNGAVNPLVRTGQSVLIGGTTKTVTALTTLVSSKGTAADSRWRAGYNEFGARLTFKDKSQAVYEFGISPQPSSNWYRVASTGTSQVAGITGAVVTSFGLPGFSQGTCSYLANLQVGTAGVTKGNAVALVCNGTLLARTGSPAPGLTGSNMVGVTFKTLGDPVSGSSGLTAFEATLSGTGVNSANNTGIWFTAHGVTLREIVQTGAAAPGGGHFQKFISMVLPPYYTSAGGPVFVASLKVGKADHVTSANALGLWAVDGAGTLQSLLRTGQSSSVDGVNRTVKSFTALVPTPGSVGAAGGYDLNGNVTVLATFTDGTKGLLLFTLP